MKDVAKVLALLCALEMSCANAELCSREFESYSYDTEGHSDLEMEILELSTNGNRLHARVGFDPELVDTCSFTDAPCTDGELDWTLPWVAGAPEGRELAGTRGPGAAGVDDSFVSITLGDENRDVLFYAGGGAPTGIEPTHERDESLCQAGAFADGYFTSVVVHSDDGDRIVPAGGSAAVQMRGVDFALNVPWSFDGGGRTLTIVNLWPR